jgi:hypothetical protein
LGPKRDAKAVGPKNVAFFLPPFCLDFFDPRTGNGFILKKCRFCFFVSLATIREKWPGSLTTSFGFQRIIENKGGQTPITFMWQKNCTFQAWILEVIRP